MKLPQAAMVRVPRHGIENIPHHIYGPKKYLLFGPRKIMETIYLPSRSVIRNGMFDFGEHKIEAGVKLPIVAFDDRTYYGVTPVQQVDYSTKWWCCIDTYKMKSNR